MSASCATRQRVARTRGPEHRESSRERHDHARTRGCRRRARCWARAASGGRVGGRVVGDRHLTITEPVTQLRRAARRAWHRERRATSAAGTFEPLAAAPQRTRANKAAIQNRTAACLLSSPIAGMSIAISRTVGRPMHLGAEQPQSVAWATGRRHPEASSANHRHRYDHANRIANGTHQRPSEPRPAARPAAQSRRARSELAARRSSVT